MTNQYEQAGARPATHALMGTVLLAVGGVLFLNLKEDPDIMVLAVLVTALGLSFLIAGAVARGIVLADR